MNSEKENPIVEIRSAEDAAKWVGRKVQLFWQGGGARAIGVFWTIGHESGVPGHACFTACVGGIELLDGAAHPRPEGDGWVWCETSEQAAAAFAGVTCDADMGAGDRSITRTPQRTTVRGGGQELEPEFNGDANSAWRGYWITSRGGAWIRPVISEPAKTPEREAADALEIETVAADDAAQAASARATVLHAQLRYAQREAEEADERDSRTKADVLWALPDGWTWVRYNGKPAASADKSLGYCGSSVLVSGDSDLDLNITVSDDIDNWVPFTVAEVVIARYRAENPE